MGVAIAKECARNGAQVKLILGPSNIDVKETNINIARVESAKEMMEVVERNFNDTNISIFAAAVSDYAPKYTQKNKIKKKDKDFKLSLRPTTDILFEMGLRKNVGQFLVGFALESENELENAKDKLKRKNLDMIVLNSINDKDSGFNFDTNKITIIDKQNNILNFELKDKAEVAKDIVRRIIKLSK